MDQAVPETYLKEILDRTLRRVTQKTAGIRLPTGIRRDPGVRAPEVDGLYTVYTVFERGFGSALALSADAALFTRIARQMLFTQDVAPGDAEDCAKEYFNIVCGHIAAEIYRSTNISPRFQVPGFCCGHYVPEKRRELFAITYAGGRDGAARLTHYTCAPEGKTGRALILH